MAFDLDNEELEATRRLNGVAKNNIEKDIKILEDKDCLINYPELQVLEAIEHILAEREKNKKKIKELEVLEDDLKDKRVVYIDTPEFEGNYIPKQKVIEEVDKLLNTFRKVEFNRVTAWNSLIQLKEKLLEDK